VTLTFIHITDTHISADPNYDPFWVDKSVEHPNVYMERLIEVINNLPFEIDFILHTGDVCAEATANDCRTARQMLCQLHRPIYMIPGNHDSADLMSSIIHNGETLHVLRNDMVSILDYQLIGLDTNGIGDAHAPTVAYEQINDLRHRLYDNNKPLIVATHHPLIPTGVSWIDTQMRVQNGEQLHDVLRPYASHLRGVFHGHIHQPTNSYYDGILYVGSPSTWYNLQADPTTQEDTDDLPMPGGFNLVMIRDNRTFIRRYVL